jgi:hypothetical protein
MHTRSQAFDFIEHVRREDHGQARRAGLAHDGNHVAAHGRVEVRRGLVEDQ